MRRVSAATRGANKHRLITSARMPDDFLTMVLAPRSSTKPGVHQELRGRKSWFECQHEHSHERLAKRNANLSLWPGR